MNYYLVDLENVQSKGLMGADLLGPEDCIVIFYSPAVRNVHELERERIRRGGASVMIRCAQIRTKDALDFELSLYAGIVLSSMNPDRIFIISEDGGYRATLEAGNREARLSGRKEKILFQCRSLLEAWYQKEMPLVFDGQDKPVPVKELKSLKTEMAYTAGAIAARHGVDKEKLEEIIQSSGNSRPALYRNMIHVFGRKKGLALYREIRIIREREGLL